MRGVKRATTPRVLKTLEEHIPIAETLQSNEESTAPSTVIMTPKLGLLGIGTEVMRQFSAGLFMGTVQSYNSKDGLYKIEYTDGDREDMDEPEYIYAYQSVGLGQ